MAAVAPFSTTGFDSAYKSLRSSCASGRTKDLAWRKWQLKQMYWLLDEYESELQQAMFKDLHRHAFESLAYDLAETKGAILEAINNLESWAKGEAPPHGGILWNWIGRAWIRKEPFGLVLIIGAWNYPIGTLLTVAVSAIAAGNAVVLKPSEMTSHTEALLVKLVARYMDPEAIAIVSAGPAEMGTLLKHRFDFIFYTGSSRVGRIIATAAAAHVTPTALELGGQAPAIVTKHANIDLAAKRIANAKLINLGQLCVNVNHVFAEAEIYDELNDRLRHWMAKFVDEGRETLSHLINHQHFDRLRGLLDKSKGTTIYTGEHNRETKWLHPTIVKDVTMSDSVLSEEIFGPILPVVKTDVKSALRTINAMPHPLALYVFSKKQSEIDRILDETRSGGVTVNDIAVHNDVTSAPFGGVGESGYGSYHGKWGFDTFSHNRTVVYMPGFLDRFVGWRYPPFDMKNRGEVDSHKPNFKKGEGLADQRVGKKGWLWFF
ncbi:putative succinate semialdehyde dehydrogenase [Aspergillus karnatakaensis]|uniref:aldehyde dehydrogenase family protein n=1 Tax=Aspergillus karnatakaensis TaxID=1810916 RepID=UPI003CCD89DF